MSDNRRGFFNHAPNYGNQTYNEGPHQRKAPDELATGIAGAGAHITIQVRVYGMSPEQRNLGGDIESKLTASGVSVISFGQDHGTDEFTGISIDSGDDAATVAIANEISAKFEGAGHQVRRQSVPWPANAIRIGVGN